jgi:hypothetical protein
MGVDSSSRGSKGEVQVGADSYGGGNFVLGRR